MGGTVTRMAPPVDEPLSLPETRDALGKRVDALLDAHCAAQRRAAPHGLARELWEHIAISLKGGKRLRPQLVGVAYAGFGGRSTEACAAAGAAFELLHGALLVHDDVIDRDFVRRGRPNIAGIYRERGALRGRSPSSAGHLGASVAIIAGDLLLSASFRMLERTTAEPTVRERLAEVFQGAVTDAAAGELADVLMARDGDGPSTVDDVLEMERLKTAVYSFEAPLRVGAILAGASPAEIDAVGRIGALVGMAYQIIDDVLGTFGDERQTGKPTASDFREGKLTVLTALAREDPSVARHLASATVDQAGTEEQLREALDRAGAREQALGLAHSLVSEALDEAGRSRLPSALRSELTRVCNHVLHRER